MRLLVLGGLGAFPERLAALASETAGLRYVATEDASWIRDRIPFMQVQQLADLGADALSRIDALRAIIERGSFDCIYSLLNVWDGSNAATAALLRRGVSAPVVRHYKEHYVEPSEDERTAIERSAGVIFINEPSREHFASVYRLPEKVACLDADQIPRRHLAGTLRPKLSAADGRPRVLIAGSATDDGGRYDYRPAIRELTSNGVEVHLYGLFRTFDPSAGILRNTAEVSGSYASMDAGGLLRIHPPVPPERFVEAWSPYDGGLLHAESAERFRALNVPNRYSAYLAAGVAVALRRGEAPWLERRLGGAAVAYDRPGDLATVLPDPAASAAALALRERHTFEATVPELVAFLESCARAQ